MVAGQRLTQAAGDVLLGWLTADGIDGKRRDFYVRQLWDGKGSAEIEAMERRDDDRLRPPLRLDPGPRPRADRRPRARSPPTSARATASTARSPSSPQAYADQNEADYQELIEAEAAGDLTVESGL